MLEAQRSGARKKPGAELTVAVSGLVAARPGNSREDQGSFVGHSTLWEFPGRGQQVRVNSSQRWWPRGTHRSLVRIPHREKTLNRSEAIVVALSQGDLEDKGSPGSLLGMVWHHVHSVWKLSWGPVQEEAWWRRTLTGVYSNILNIHCTSFVCWKCLSALDISLC